MKRRREIPEWEKLGFTWMLPIRKHGTMHYIRVPKDDRLSFDMKVGDLLRLEVVAIQRGQLYRRRVQARLGEEKEEAEK
jgi:hypothetical protein